MSKAIVMAGCRPSPMPSTLAGIECKGFVREFVRHRRMAAVHEAGHVVIAKMLGIPVLASITVRSDLDFDFRRERIWAGWTLRIGDTANDEQLRMFGVAGAVAELCWLREPVDLCFGDLMSESDCAIAQCDPDYPDDECMDAAFAVAKILRPDGSYWHRVLHEARKLIVTRRGLLRANKEQIAACENAV